MKYIYIIFFLFLTISTKAQYNFVPNGSFEMVDSCYINCNGIGTSNPCWGPNGGLPSPRYALPWYDPLYATCNSSADYFRPDIGNCFGSSVQELNTPNNVFGIQHPHSGIAYMGFGNYTDTNFLFSTPLYEYIDAPLLKPLEAGKKYCGRFFASPADYFSAICSNVGMSLSTAKYDLNDTIGNTFTQIRAIPQINNYPPNNLFFDISLWYQVKGSFIADGTEKHITIGNFTPYPNTAFFTNNNDTIVHPQNGPVAYLFIDDVELIAFTALDSKDTSICPQHNFPKQLNAHVGFDSYLWSTGDTTSSISINAPGQYWVTASNWCGTVTDTITVSIFDTLSIQHPLGADKTLCDYQFPQRLRPLPQYENTFTNYQWSTGSDSSFTDLLLPGVYTLTAEHLCGFVTDTINLTLAPNPQVNLGNDTTLCIGQQITLNAGNHNSYTWNNQSIAPAITVNQTGNYSVTVSNALNCIASDNIQVNFVQETAQLLPNDTALYASAFPYTINLSNQYSNYQSSQLTINNLQLTINNEGTYSLTAIDNYGCLVSDSINIKLKTFELIIPSIIPKNQNLIINNLPANSSLKVFDALGQIIYQSSNYQNNFMPLMAHAVYFVELAYVVDNQSKKYLGKLLVVE
jgi:hypothetical protein